MGEDKGKIEPVFDELPLQFLRERLNRLKATGGFPVACEHLQNAINNHEGKTNGKRKIVLPAGFVR